MKNRFKFRFWFKDTQEMIYSEKFNDVQTLGQWLFEDRKDVIKMQCTGLKDKNGKLIYEGDVVKAKHKPDREGWYCVWRGVVEYDNENCQYVIKASHYSVLNETKLNKATFENNESFIWFDWLEIIGNIYENKELLNDSN